MTQPVFETTATALREKSKLQRHFRRFDVFFYLICTVVTIDGAVGAVGSAINSVSTTPDLDRAGRARRSSSCRRHRVSARSGGAGKYVRGGLHFGAWARGAVLTFFVVSVAIFAARHGVHGFGGHAFLPTYAVFIAVVPVLFFNYAGLRCPRRRARR